MINRAVDGDRLIRINAGNDFTINAGKLQVAGNRYILTLHSVAREGKSADSRVLSDIGRRGAVGNSRIKDHETFNVRKLMVGTVRILSKRAVLDDEFLTRYESRILLEILQRVFTRNGGFNHRTRAFESLIGEISSLPIFINEIADAGQEVTVIR